MPRIKYRRWATKRQYPSGTFLWLLARHGIGTFDGLSGGGRISAVFESKAGEGRETLTGTVTADGGE
jgi:hypothetical protein